MKTMIYVVFALFIISESYCQYYPDPDKPIDTLLIRTIDLTNDGVADTLGIRIKADKLLSPIWWKLAIISKGDTLYSHCEIDDDLDLSIKDSVKSRNHNIEMRRSIYYHQFSGISLYQFSGKSDYSDKPYGMLGPMGILNRKYDGSIYKVAKEYLVNRFNLDSLEADSIVEKKSSEIKEGETKIVVHGYHGGKYLWIYFKEVNAFVPIYDNYGKSIDIDYP